MVDKSCGNCHYAELKKGFICPHSSLCLTNNYEYWKPHPPTQPDEVVGIKIKCPKCDGFKAISQGCFGGTACDMCEATGKIFTQINPNTSPELIAWARSKALELVEIDKERLEIIAMKYIASTRTPQWLVSLLLEVFEQNPLKLKPLK